MSVGAELTTSNEQATSLDENTEETVEAPDSTVSEQQTDQADQAEEVSAEEGSAETAEEAGREAPPEETTEPEAETKPEWITDEDQAVASSYGLTETELAGFENKVDFYRACWLADQIAARRFRQAQEKPAEESTGKVDEKPDERLGEKKGIPAEEDLTIDPAKYAEYDPDTLHLVKAVRRLQEDVRSGRADLASASERIDQEFARLREERQKEAVRMEMDYFDETMDKFEEDLFGGSNPSQEHRDRREKVWDTYCNVVNMFPSDSDDTPSRQELIRRARMMAFGEEILEAQRKAIYQELHEQSRGRRPGPGRGKSSGPPSSESTAPTGEPLTFNEQAKKIIEDPEMAAIFNRSEEESGNAPQ